VAPRERLVRDYAKGVEVSPVVDGFVVARLLRRHVSWRARRFARLGQCICLVASATRATIWGLRLTGPAGRAGDTKVGDRPVFVEQDIRGLMSR
jgi:hypothetical protein